MGDSTSVKIRVICVLKRSELFHHGFDSLHNPLRIKPAFVVEFRVGALLDETVGNTETLHSGLVPMIRHEFQDGAAKAAHDGAVLHSNDFAEFPEYPVE